MNRRITGHTKIPAFSTTFVVPIVLCMVIGIFCTSCQVNDKSNNPYETVAEINGIPVAAGELQLFVEDARQLTHSYFKQAYQLDEITGENWTKDFGGESPVDYAINLALEKLTIYKLTQQALLEQGALEDISYRAFIEKWEAENAERKEKKENGEVIYGPVEYTERVYYDYLYNEYQTTLRKLLTTEPTESDLRQIYDENPDMFSPFGTVTMQCILLPQTGYSESDALTVQDAIRKGISDGKSFSQAAGEEGISAYVQERTFTADDISTPDVTKYPDIEDALYRLDVNEISGPIDDSGMQWIILYCEKREGTDRKRFEECMEELTAIYQEDSFDRKFTEASEAAQITIYDNARDIIK